VILPPSRWQRVAITALLVLPLVLIVVLSAPTWLVLPFLSEPRRDAVLRFLASLIDWVKAIPGASETAPIAKSASRDAPVPEVVFESQPVEENKPGATDLTSR
jgi:hypothetical protein